MTSSTNFKHKAMLVGFEVRGSNLLRLYRKGVRASGIIYGMGLAKLEDVHEAVKKAKKWYRFGLPVRIDGYDHFNNQSKCGFKCNRFDVYGDGSLVMHVEDCFGNRFYRAYKGLSEGKYF